MAPRGTATPRWPVALLALACLVLIVSGAWFFRVQGRAARTKTEQDLTAIARLKADQLAAWRIDQLEDAATLQQHPYLPGRVARFLADPSTTHRRELLAELRNLATQHDYADILLVDAAGTMILGLEPNSAQHVGYRKVLAAALGDGRPRLSALHVDLAPDRPDLSAVTPLHVAIDGVRRPIGALVLVSEARQFLQPVTRLWPVPSETAETMLVQADGDSVLFLGNLRHRPGAAMTLRLPLDADVISALAARGQTGFVRAPDYRGVPVAAVIVPVAGSPWILAAKMDEQEAFAAWRFQSRLAWALMLGLIGFLVSMAIVLRQHAAAEHYRSLFNAESALRKSEERFRATFEQAGESVVITDPDGIIEYVNPAFEQVTGYGADEAVGQNPRLIKSDEHDEAFYREMWQTITAGAVWRGRVVNRRKDGVLFTEDATISPVFDHERRIVNFVAVKRDVTERLRLEAQLRQAQTLESVGRLAGGVAHDFNNMLGVIKGHAELAMDDAGPDSPLRESLERILEAAERSARLTRQLLGFARRQTIAPRPLDLNATLQGMLGFLRRLIGEDIELRWLPEKDAGMVRMDPSQLDQVLANLCINARDAIGDVGTISVETADVTLDESYCAHNAGARPGRFVMLAVSDDGCGMDRRTRDQIFEPFFSTKASGQGTGLGLATVYGIVQQNDGFINVYSEPQRGSTFRIYLPRMADAAVEAASAEVAEPRPEQGEGEIILLVEDEAAIAEASATMLRKLGYRVEAARTPEEALRIVAEAREPVRLLVTDVILPGMNGRDLAQRLLDFDPALKVLYMSGYTANVIADRGVLHDGVNFLAKPFSRNDLAAKVREVLDAV